MDKNFFARQWRGEDPLPQVFWLYGVFPSLLAIIIVAALARAGWIGDTLLALLVLLLFVYTVWILVAVWRTAARRGDNDLYGVMARWLTVAWAINALLVGGFILLNILLA